jgi:hypothetical protein
MPSAIAWPALVFIGPTLATIDTVRNRPKFFATLDTAACQERAFAVDTRNAQQATCEPSAFSGPTMRQAGASLVHGADDEQGATTDESEEDIMRKANFGFLAAAVLAIMSACGGAPVEGAPGGVDESQGASGSEIGEESSALGPTSSFGDDCGGPFGLGRCDLRPPSVKRTDKCPVYCHDYSDENGKSARCCTSAYPRLGNIFTGYWYCSSECVRVN